jgi:hypothetical protein
MIRQLAAESQCLSGATLMRETDMAMMGWQRRERGLLKHETGERHGEKMWKEMQGKTAQDE